jgi:predicted O-linked N-acetylglucosamine transferase (SPINDLY family)
VLEAWAEILRQAPHARLRLRYRSDLAHPPLQEKLRRRFEFAGDRVTIEAGMLPSSEHLACIGACDVHLDTWPFPGSTTTFTAAWMGVPTLTMGGDTIMSNYGVGMNRQFRLSSLGAGGFTVRNVDAYIARAVEFTHNRAALAPVRAGLRERVRATACRPNAREFGRWLRVLWRRHCARSTLNQAA